MSDYVSISWTIDAGALRLATDREAAFKREVAAIEVALRAEMVKAGVLDEPGNG